LDAGADRVLNSLDEDGVTAFNSFLEHMKEGEEFREENQQILDHIFEAGGSKELLCPGPR
jgi:hypothetical protein